MRNEADREDISFEKSFHLTLFLIYLLCAPSSRNGFTHFIIWCGLDCMFFCLVPKPFVVFYVASSCGLLTAIGLLFFGIQSFSRLLVISLSIIGGDDGGGVSSG